MRVRGAGGAEFEIDPDLASESVRGQIRSGELAVVNEDGDVTAVADVQLAPEPEPQVKARGKKAPAEPEAPAIPAESPPAGTVIEAPVVPPPPSQA